MQYNGLQLNNKKKRNKLRINVTTWMNLKIIMLSQNNQARRGGGNTVSLLISNTKKLQTIVLQ